MNLQSFLHVCAIANDPKGYNDSVIFVYTDTCSVFGPFFGEKEQFNQYDLAMKTGRPFKVTAWAHKG